jgi:hypothetical protein
MLAKQSHGENSHGRDHEYEGENSFQGGRQPTITTRQVKLDFPRFNGDEDPTMWICRAEQFFRFQGTLEGEKTALASFHLEGEAQMWFQILIREEREIGWPEFTAGLLTRFGPNQFYDPFGELTKLQHEGTVRGYQAKFESLLSKIGVLSQTRQVSCFISGLKEVLWADVITGKPTTLTSAIGLARLYEARQSAITRSNQSEGRKAAIGSWQSATQPFMPIKRLTPKELKERQAKGLCFKCNDKYGPGHRCKWLFMIEAYLEEEEDGEQVMGEEESGPTEPPEISLHAITGTKVPEGEQP